MQNISQWITLVAMVLAGGFFSGVITNAIKREHWPSFVKFIVSVVVAIAVALAGLWLTGSVQAVVALWGHLTAADVWRFGVLVFSASAAWYQFYFKNAAWAVKLGAWGSNKAA
jgi:hypothetical protein